MIETVGASRALPPRWPHALAAALLSVLQPGLGQVYLGRAKRSLWVLVGSMALLFAAGAVGWMSRFPGYVTVRGLMFVAQLSLLTDAVVLGWKHGRVTRIYNRWSLFPVVSAVMMAAWYGPIIVGQPLLGFRTSRFPAASMEPTLHAGDSILYDTHAYSGGRSPRRGDVIVFRYPEEPSVLYVKRVVGLGMDELEITGGKLLVNGKVIEEPYARESNSLPMDRTLVPPGGLFVLGDHRDRSLDSRQFGAIRPEAVQGRVTSIIFSPATWRIGIPVSNSWSESTRVGR